jgi:hypothetical protein
MPSARAANIARLEELCRRFEDAAFDFPGVGAAVVSRPDIWSAEAEHAYFEGSRRWAKCTEERCREISKRHAHEDGERVIPGGDWLHRTVQHILSYTASDASLPPLERWWFALFGPPGPPFLPAQAFVSLFEALCADAARAVGQAGRGDRPISSWLIHLADREARLRPASRKQCVVWEQLDPNSPCRARWVPLPAANPPGWWAVRLDNVCDLSALAVGQVIEAAGTGAGPRRLSKRERNVRVGDYLKRNSARAAAGEVSIREVHDATGISTTSIDRTDAWGAYQEELKKRGLWKGRQKGKTLALTKKMEEIVAADNTLTELMGELSAEGECDPSAAGHQGALRVIQHF